MTFVSKNQLKNLCSLLTLYACIIKTPVAMVTSSSVLLVLTVTPKRLLITLVTDQKNLITLTTSGKTFIIESHYLGNRQKCRPMMIGLVNYHGNGWRTLAQAQSRSWWSGWRFGLQTGCEVSAGENQSWRISQCSYCSVTSDGMMKKSIETLKNRSQKPWHIQTKERLRFSLHASLIKNSPQCIMGQPVAISAP